MTQILTGQATTLTFTVYVDGDPTTAGAGTLNLVDVDGDTHYTVALTDLGAGVYTAAITAQTEVGWYRAQLVFDAGATIIDHSQVEVVGGVLFTEHAARQYDDGRLGSAAKYSDDAIADERARVSDWLESHTGRSWVPRWRRLHFVGTGRSDMLASSATRTEGPSGGEGAGVDIQRVIGATVNGSAVTGVETDGVRLYRSGGFQRGTTPLSNVVVDVAYGLPHPRSGVDRVALLELVDRLPSSRVPRTATSARDELGSYGWEPQNNGRPSRIPDVNAWLRVNDVRAGIA